MTTRYWIRGIFFQLITGCLLFCSCSAGTSSETTLSVHGAVEHPLDLSMEEIQGMPEFHINYVSSLKEKLSPSDKEELVEIANYGGVLLRDVLEKAGMEHKRKYEPGVYFRTKGSDGKEVIFSFGEIIYSSIGRSTLLAYRKNGKLTGDLELIISNDIRNSRRISGVSEIVVERVDIPMNVYKEKEDNVVQPPTQELTILDKKTGKSRTITLADLEILPGINLFDKVQIGDCEGFRGVYSYAGATLRALLESAGFASFPYQYDRYVAVTSKSGFSATYSMGELFNSKLGNNIIVAYKKDGAILGKDEGFAMMAVGEDSTGGRSVKCISEIYIY